MSRSKRFRKGTVLAVGVSALLMLGACGHPIKEVDDPMSGAQSGAQSGGQSGAMSGAEQGEVTLTSHQVHRIIGEVQEVLDLALEEGDPSILDQRLSGPALLMRKAQFIRADNTSTELAPLVINPSVFSATVGTSWPRVLLVASEAEKDVPGEVFFLTQQDARSDYMLENWTRLVGGTSVRGVSIRDGSKVLEADAAGLEFSPQDAIETYVNYLNSPDNEEYQVFEDNVFGPRYREELKTLNEAIEVAGKVTAQANVTDYPTVGVALDTGSALVAAAFSYTTTYHRTVPGSSLELAGTPASYFEDPEVIGTVSVKYLVTIFFVVPPKGSDQQIQVVGAERAITSVSRDDTEPSDD